MKSETTSTETPARGSASIREQQLRGMEDKEAISRHKNDIATDTVAEGHGTAERKERNTSRDVETKDVNVQKLKKLFEEVAKEEQRPSPERTARMQEMKSEIGEQKETIKQRAAKLEKQMEPAKEERNIESHKTQGAVQQPAAKQAKAEQNQYPGNTSITAPQAQGSLQQGQVSNKGQSVGGSNTGKNIMIGLGIGALLMINPLLALLAAVLVTVAESGKEQRGSSTQGFQTPQQAPKQESAVSQQVQQSQSRGTSQTASLADRPITGGVNSGKTQATQQTESLADRPITGGITGGQTQKVQQTEAKKPITVPENAAPGIKDRASALAQAMGGEFGTRAPTKAANQLPEQPKQTVGVSKFASEGIKAQAAALIKNSGAQFGTPSDVKGATKQSTSVAAPAASQGAAR